VDVRGKPVPSSRFMGGREVELLEMATAEPVDIGSSLDTLVHIAQTMIKTGVMATPTFQKGVGPFPARTGRWNQRPSDQIGRRAVAGLYLALMADTCLDLIGSRETVVIEGRFINDLIFVRALAALRPSQVIFLSDANNSLPYGALRMIDSDLAPSQTLVRVEPLAGDLKRYAAAWQAMLRS
jgi:hypothetical protein